MTSFLLLSNDKKRIKDEIDHICNEFSIHPLDLTTITKPNEAKGETGRKITRSIGIEDIKKMRQHIFLKPFSGKVKAVIIEDGERLTPEAQNALLKVLEEPPEHTIIVIASNTRDAVLPTIQSRCTIREFTSSLSTNDDDTRDILQTLAALTADKALVLAETLEKRKEILPEKLEKVVVALHDKLSITNTEEQVTIARTIRTLQVAHRILTTSNSNQRLTLEAAFLSLCKQ